MQDRPFDILEKNILTSSTGFYLQIKLNTRDICVAVFVVAVVNLGAVKTLGDQLLLYYRPLKKFFLAGRKFLCIGVL